MRKNEKYFNLLDEPWIRVLERGRSIREVSLTETLMNAHDYERLAGELPTQDFAILRLLLAVLHTVFSRVDENGDPNPLYEENAVDRWVALWKIGQFPREPVRCYLETWHERFWLFHPERPFYQVPEAGIGTEYTSAKLNGVISESGNKLRLFPNKLGDGKEFLSYGEAARWLLYVNCYDDTSSKAKAKNLPSPGAGWLGKLGLIAAEGDNLFETLMLNLTLLKDGIDEWEACHPVWEAEKPRTEERTEISVPNDPAALLTVQSRRLILEEKDGFVIGYRLLGGDFFSKIDAFSEQMTVWKPIFESNRKKELVGFQPRRHDPSKQIWREFSSITETGDGFHRPGVVSWVATLKNEPDLLLENIKVVRFNIASVQYGDKDFFVSNVFSDSLTFHLNLLSVLGETLLPRVEKEIQRCDKIAQIVGDLASDLEKAMGGDGNVRRNQGKEQYYDQIDDPFRRWLATLDPTEKDRDREERIANWKKTSLEIACRLGEMLVEQAGEEVFIGRDVWKSEGKNKVKQHYSSPEAYGRFLSRLAKLDS